MSIKSLMLASILALAAIVVGNESWSADKSAESGNKQVTKSVTQSTQAYLGLGVSTLPPVLTSHLPDVIGKGRGILVTEVSDGSPAEKAGLQKHDVVIRYDDQDLYSPEQLVKRVRNEQPGQEIELEYVRGGKVATVKVTLGERESPAAVTEDWLGRMNDWPGFNRRFSFPMLPLRPDFFTEADDLGNDGTEWTYFESMSITKDAEGKYRAMVKYKADDGSMVNREYSGTRQEVRDAIESDKELPEDRKQQLMRSLDDRLDTSLPKFQMPKFPSLDWSSQLFNWPNVDL